MGRHRGLPYFHKDGPLEPLSLDQWDSVRLQKAKALLAAAENLPPQQRRSFLEDACGEDAAFFQQMLTFLSDDGTDPDEVIRPVRALLQSRAGELLGNWRLLKPLGLGGMGAVWLAERADHAFSMLVAVKFIQHHLQSDELIARFKRERQVLADLKHPHIATLHDGGTSPDGLPYLVMEYIEGVTIDVWAQQEQPTEEILRLVRQVGTACDHAHRMGILHRDIKPANILVTPNGDIKLLDFGIADFLGEEHTALTGSALSPMTPIYASPEQWANGTVTAQSDIYSLGLVLLTLLTGAPQKEPMTALDQWAAEQAPPAALKRLLAAMLAPDAKDRMASMAEVIAAVDGLSQPPAAPTRPSKPVLVLLVLLVLVGLWRYGSLGALSGPALRAEDGQLFDHRSGSYNVLILPFAPLQNCTTLDTHIELTMLSRLREMSEKDRLNLQVAFLKSDRCPQSFEEGRQVGLKHGADLVVWGDMYEQCEGEQEACLKYALVHQVPTGLQEMGQTEIERIRLSEIKQGKLQKDIDFIIYWTLGLQAYARQDFSRAVAFFEMIRDSQSPEYFFTLGSSHLPLGNWDEAIAAYDRAIALDPRFAKAYNNRGYVHRITGHPAKAIADYNQAIAIDPTYFGAYSNRGATYRILGKLELTIADYNRAIALQPQFASAYNNRGNAWYYLGNYEPAIADYNRSISLNPDEALSFLNRGLAYDALEKYGEAIADYNRAIDLDPSVAVVYKHRGNAFRAQELWDLAIADYDRAIALKPDGAVLYFHRGNCRSALGHTPEAMADYNRALEIQPDSASAYRRRAFLHFNLGNRAQAVADYERAISLEPGSGHEQYNLACIYALENEPLKALSYLTQALERDSDTYFEMAQNDADLNGLRGLAGFKALMSRFSEKD